MRLITTVSMLALLTVAVPALAAEDYIMMKIGTQEVAASEVKKFWEGLFPAGQAPAFESVKPDVHDKVLRGVMAEKILYTEALVKNIDKSDAVQKQLEDIRKKLMVKALLDTKTGDISDADLKKEYDTVLAASKDEREVHARHILLPSEAEAKDARKKIDDGKSFEEVAKEYSKDAGSARNGGDLGYFTKDKMVKEFADAAFSMKKGEISPPVKSSFGWHIIKVEDSRKLTPPPFSEVKEQIRAKLQEKKLNEYVAGLVKNTDVKVYDVKGKELPFEKNLPSADKPTASVKADAKADKPSEKKTETKVLDKSVPKPAEKKDDKPVEPPKSEKPDKPSDSAR